MSEKIKVAIAGYGNIGRGVEAAIAQNEDMVLTTVFTRYRCGNTLRRFCDRFASARSRTCCTF